MKVKPPLFVIFDLDGTLIDSDATVIEIINQIRVEQFLDPLLDHEIRPFLANGGTHLIKNTITNTNCEEKNTQILNLLRTKYFNMNTRDCLYPDVHNALKRLITHHFQLFLCTNKANFLVRKILKDLHLHNYFTRIIADGDLDTRKPNSENFFACLEGLEFELNKCIIIGDSAIDMELAKNSGVAFCAFNNGYNEKFILENTVKYFDRYQKLTPKFISQQIG